MSAEHLAEQTAGEQSRVKVLYVIGYGRSGSTIFGNILGELPGVVHVGELRSLWGLGMLGRRVCGCGSPIRECEFWTSVVKHGFQGEPWNGIDASEVLALQRESIRLRTTPGLIRATSGRGRRSAALRAYAGIADRLYVAIREVANATMIVDTSKHVPDGALVPLLPSVEASFVHLVRDPRAVVHSWERVMRSPGEGRTEEMPRHSPAASARSWLLTNLAAEAVRRTAQPERSMLVRYEDFVAAPRATMERIAGMIGAPSGDLPFLDEATVRLGGNHTAGGNPSRLAGGATTIRDDDEWRRAQRPAARAVATAIALPLLRRYGYPMAPGGR